MSADRFTSEHREVRELLAVFAMGLTGGDECQRIEHHLASCAACRDELVHHEQVVGSLALSQQPVDPSPDVLARLLASPEIAGAPASTTADNVAVAAAAVNDSVEATAPVADDVPATPVASLAGARSSRRRRREFAWPRMVMPAMAAACLVFALVTAVSLVQLSHVRGQRADALSAAAAARGELKVDRKAADAPTLDVALRSNPVQVSAGLVAAHIEIARLQNGKLVAVFRDMPNAPDGRAWQAWRIDAKGTPHSLGTMTEGGRVLVLSVPKIGETRAFAITNEPAGGSDKPTTQPQAYGTLA